MKPRYSTHSRFKRNSESLFGPNASPRYIHGEDTRLLRVQNDYFTAGAIWLRTDGVWSCIDAAPIIAWMRRTPFDQIKNELLKRGCSWEWLRELDSDKATVGIVTPPLLRESQPPSTAQATGIDLALPETCMACCP